MSLTRRDRLVLASPFVAAALLALAAPLEDGPTICPFALCTGMACPGCGMTRAASYLVRGEFGAAAGYHPLVPLIAIQLIGGWVWYALRKTGRVGPMAPKALNLTLLATAAALVLVWALRLVGGTLPQV